MKFHSNIIIFITMTKYRSRIHLWLIIHTQILLMDYKGSNILFFMANKQIDHAKFHQIQQALLSSCCASSQQEINEASYIITCHQDQEGYVIYLIEIINHALSLAVSQNSERLISCALTQLKVFLRKSWREMTPPDRQYLTNSLVRTNINVCRVSNLRHQAGCMKLMKDVAMITGVECTNIYDEVYQSIKANLYSSQCVYVLPACLNIVLGAINNISLLVTMEFSQKSISLIERLHPLLMNFTNWGEKQIHGLYEQLVTQQGDQTVSDWYLQFKRKYEEILYLNLKLLYKILFIKNTENIEHICLAWIPIIFNRVSYIDPSFTSPDHHDLDMGLRGTDKFNYFHGKKWAFKLLRMIMSKILVFRDKQSPKAKLVINFYLQNLKRFMEIFREAWQQQWPEKIKFQLLRIFEKLIIYQGQQLLKNFVEDLRNFQQVLLPPMMLFTNELDILKENPSEFLYREQNLWDKYTPQLQSCRLTAARVWLDIANIEFLHNPRCVESQMLMASLVQLLDYLNPDKDQSMQVRDLGYFLLTKLSRRVIQNDKIKVNIGNAVIRIIRDCLNQKGQLMMVVRAFELAKEYLQLIDDQTKRALVRSVIVIFLQINQKQHIPYDVTAALQRGIPVLCKIVSIQSQQNTHMSLEEAKTIISVLLAIVNSTVNQEFILLVSDFLSACTRYLGSSHKELAMYLKGWFVKYVQKDLELYQTVPARDYNRSYHDIAMGTISIYETILTHLNKSDTETAKILDIEVAGIVSYILSLKDQHDDMLEKGIDLLSTYLQVKETNNIHIPILRLCRVVILRIAGLPLHYLQQLKQALQSAQRNKRWIEMLLNCRERLAQGLDNFVVIVRLFIKHIPFGEEVRSFGEITNGILQESTKDTEHLIYLIGRYFASNDPSEYEQTFKGKCFSMLALIHYYEHHQRKECTHPIHASVNQFVFILMLQVTREYMAKRSIAKYNAQLFCLWIHQVKQNFIQYTTSIPLEELAQFFNNIFIFQKHYGLRQLFHFEQSIRCIFGLSTFIRLGLNYNDLWALLPVQLWVALITSSIRFGYKSTEAYADQDQEDSYVLNSDDQWGDVDEDEEEEELANPSQKNKSGMEEDTSVMQMFNTPYQFESEEEGESEGLSDQEREDCLDYEEADNHMTPSPLEQHDDCMYLLETLYELSQSKMALYRQIITDKGLGMKIDAIIESAQCHHLPERKHFYRLSPDHWDI